MGRDMTERFSCRSVCLTGSAAKERDGKQMLAAVFFIGFPDCSEEAPLFPNWLIVVRDTNI
jgi:hypothetical protein